MVSYQRAKMITDYVKKNSIKDAMEYFDMTADSVERYCRILGYKERKKEGPKILIADIETLPAWCRVWGLYKQRIPIDNLLKDWVMCSWSAKWLNAPDIMSDCLTPKEASDRYNSRNIEDNTDKRICKSIYSLVDAADIIIGHNLNRFDMRKLRSRFLINDMKPFSPAQQVDKLKQSQKQFAHTSHKLDWLGQLKRRKGKLATNYGLWKRCEIGEPEALQYMNQYCGEDVFLEEEVYLWMLPWMSAHPNIALYQECDKKACKFCGYPVKFVDKYFYTVVNRYDAYQCTGCGAYSRARSTDVGKSERGTILA